MKKNTLDEIIKKPDYFLLEIDEVVKQLEKIPILIEEEEHKKVLQAISALINASIGKTNQENYVQFVLQPHLAKFTDLYRLRTLYAIR